MSEPEQKLIKLAEESWGWDAMLNYLNGCYRWLHNIPSGEKKEIAQFVKAEEVPVFTEVVKLYIIETNEGVFTDSNYKVFQKI